ncbi:tetratricopeptide repeat protein [Pelotomaculum propionicicum]|uniref:Lipopolysaccharide assembly protein B n=1 Tax=Pelotomaculum propionicicum TaxID=258475 RepID=A0A4Y7RVJ7_9FIRM|nr:tetratricopeptide repeat protein [Pelotomaculum propionicicum]NLI14028.1 tetratricopeptide repeat protein [Peptococcaceae bacterium]TEB13024.1 Lipopolysaccharide assembly protein B [Pelotomaculum propionicicum]
MKFFGLYVLLSILTRNPLLALVILLLVFLFAEHRFIGILPDVFQPWRRAGRVAQLKREISVNPANAEAYLELGEVYFRQGKYSQAASFLENAAAKMGGHPLFHLYLGASYYYLGRVEEGKSEIEKAIAANPKVSQGEPYLYLAAISLDQKQPAETVEYIFQQLMLYGSPRVFYQAGKVFLQAGDQQRARQLFRETIDNYEACRGALRRVYRKWAFLSRISLLSIK